MRKSSKYFLVWLVFAAIGTLASKVFEVAYFFRNGDWLEYPPFSRYQLILLLLYAPIFLLTPLCVSFYHSRIEKNKVLGILAAILIIHHLICMIFTIVQIV